MAAQDYRRNRQIRVREVRLIDENGEQLGVVSTDDARRRAQDAGMDLVEVSPTARPPVCRILDFGKFKYDKKKRLAQSSHVTKTKEIRLRPKTGQHDIDFKIKKAKAFLEHRDKVQVTVLFRGREMAHIAEGRKVMEGVIEQLMDVGKLETTPEQHSRRMICTISPK